MSRQAVSKAFKHWPAGESRDGHSRSPLDSAPFINGAIAASTTGSAPASSAPAAPAPGGALAAVDSLPSFTSEEAVAVAKSACIGVLVQTHALLVSPGGLGASALEAAMAAVEGATGMLAKLGVITFTEIEDKPTELVIRRLSDQEEADIQIEAERAGAGVDADDDLDPAVAEAQS